MKGFSLLMTVWFANVLAAQAYTCNCDCRPLSRNLYQVQTHHLYYSPQDDKFSFQPHRNYLETVIKKVDENKPDKRDMISEKQMEIARKPVQSQNQFDGPGATSQDNLPTVMKSVGKKEEDKPEIKQPTQYEVMENPVEMAPKVTAQPVNKIASVSKPLPQTALNSSGGNSLQDDSVAKFVQSTKKLQESVDSKKMQNEPIISESKIEIKQPKFSINVKQNHVHHDDDEEKKEHEHEHHHHDENIKYNFEYKIHDDKTKDVKSHKEERNGDLVTGEYSLLEANGNIRTVKYTADWKNGFNAEVLNSKKARRFSPFY